MTTKEAIEATLRGDLPKLPSSNLSKGELPEDKAKVASELLAEIIATCSPVEARRLVLKFFGPRGLAALPPE